MSKATKRKHVTKEALGEYYVPEDEEKIVKILGGRGNNLHEVEDSAGDKFLVSMPTKFRKNVWIKRGDYVVVNPIKEGDKVCAEIVYVLYAKQIKYLKDENLWPCQFENVATKNSPNHIVPSTSTTECDNSDTSDDDTDLPQNLNRQAPVCYSESDETGDEDDAE